MIILYTELKKHSLCKNGYISQIVKVNKINKNQIIAMSICSKIMLQINSKLGWTNYKINLNDDIKDKRLMIIGIDSSHIKGMRTWVAMVASINPSFTDFYNKEEIIEEGEKKIKLKFCINTFINEAVSVLQKEEINKGEKPGGIVICRQGVSLQQKKILKDEISSIDVCCKAKGIQY